MAKSTWCQSLLAGQPQTPRLHDHNHTAEIVFALPPMQMHLKTEHTQTGADPDMSGEPETGAVTRIMSARAAGVGMRAGL